jgi:uncharacterized protein
MWNKTLVGIIVLLSFFATSCRYAAQQPAAQLGNVDPKIYEQYAGNYRLAKDRFVSLGAFSENNNRPTFFDSKTRRIGVLYAISEVEFVSGVIRGNELLAGDVRVKFIKNGQSVVTGLIWTEGTTPPIDAPKVSPHRNEEVAFNNGNVALRGTLTLPATKGPHPVVVLLHGSGPARRPFGMWQYFLARHGIATLTYDKRGAGDSTGDWQTASFDDLAGDALAAVQLLRTRPDINHREIGLWGNSNSGWVVPIAASRSKDVAFVISRVGSAVPPSENILYEIENDARQRGLSEQDVNKAVSLRRRYQQSIISNTGWEQLKAEVEGSRNERWFNAARVGRVLTLQLPPEDVTLQGLRNPLVFDPLPFWERVTCPVLALLGELDMNVQTSRSVPLLDAALKRAGNRDYTIVVLPQANHGLVEAATDSSPETRLNRRYAAGYMDGVIDWLLKRVDVKSD